MENDKTKKITSEIHFDNLSLPLVKRKKLYKEHMDIVMNPKEVFDPETFDPNDGVVGFDAKKRIRKQVVGKFNTMGMHPKEITEGQMIGMYESKQDIYLMFANKYNELLDRIEVLEKQLKLPK